MLNKHKKYLIVILILAVILGMKAVTGYRGNVQDNDAPRGDLSIKSYTLDADVGSVDPTIKDIFAGGSHRVAIEAPHRVSSRAKPIAITKQETSTQNDNQTQPPINDGEISRLKLLGIVFHDNKRKAFLALDSQRVIADVGDLVYGRYLLKEIAVDSANLMDTKENASKTILVSGK